MSVRAGRRILLALVLTTCAVVFVLPIAPAFADEPARVSTVQRPLIARAAARAVPTPRTVPVARMRRVIPEASRPMTASQMAATHGLSYRDAGTFVLLEAGSLRVRIYPGTPTVVIAGREYRVKDPALRSERAVVLSKRVAGFLNYKIGSWQADERARSRIYKVRRPRYGPLPPLPPKRTPTKRVTNPVRTASKALPRRQVTGAEPGWVPAVSERAWKWIVIHHSDDLRGNVAKYDDYHRNVRHWEHGCGYHFVIGNGTLSGDGEIELGPRWPRQLHGAHAKTPDNRFNDYGIGICLVGKFDTGSMRPSRAQMDALVRLVRWLKARYGIAPRNIHGHCDCCSTDCPGKNFPWAEFRRRLR